MSSQMRRPLASHRLGEKGEAHFKEICAEADLICNKSDLDLTGWDFIVEFPFSSQCGNLSFLDARATPLSCHVQVKTLWAHNNKFKVRLSSAERLAKEIKPSFFYVFVVNDALQYKTSFLIHLIGSPLEKILKRLRQVEEDQLNKINKKYITFKISEGAQIPPSGDALRKALESACGQDLHRYSDYKRNMVEQAGLDERPYRLSINFT